MKLFEERGDILQLTVSQFCARLGEWIRKRPELCRIAIVGEISGWQLRPNGAIFFSLKDDYALL
ncbi:MAG: hypothetical protein JO030_00555, partial [Candidatus Eremiobacteraeota bacterium]|nr:hypothetical protein [Candidatus Eremiobacteraeota bacterium]